MSTSAVNINDIVNGTRDRWRRDPHPDGPWVPISPVLTGVSQYRRVRPESSSSPLRADGTRAPRNWSHAGYSRWGPVGISEYYHPYRFYREEGNFGYPSTSEVPVSTGRDGDLYNKALLRALQAIKDQQLNLGVALAEARKTARLVGETAGRFAYGLDQLMGPGGLAKKFGRMAQWKKIPQRYLEYCYGFTPAMNDVYGGVQKLQDQKERGHLFNLTTTGRAKSKDVLGPYPVNWTSRVGQTWTGERTRMEQVTVCYTMPSETLANMSTLGLTNPIDVIWELTPWSFVLDWFLPIGPWLNSLDAGIFMDFREGSRSSMCHVNWTVDTGLGTPGSGAAISWQQLRAAGGRDFSFTREAFFVRRFVAFPSLRNPLNLDKMSKGLALLSQVFSRWR